MEIPGVELDEFMAFLQYLYTDSCPIEEGGATIILVLANQYGVNRLKALCEQRIKEIVRDASEASIADGKLDVIGKGNIQRKRVSKHSNL